MSRVTYRFARTADIAKLVKLRMDFLVENDPRAAKRRDLPALIHSYFRKALPRNKSLSRLRK